MGMIATIMNATRYKMLCDKQKLKLRYNRQFAMNGRTIHATKSYEIYKRRKVVIFAAGTNHFLRILRLLRGAEIGAELLIKATRVDGIYESDPEENPNAKMWIHSFDEVINKKLLSRMLLFALCRDQLWFVIKITKHGYARSSNG